MTTGTSRGAGGTGGRCKHMMALSPGDCLGSPSTCGQEGSRLHPAATGIHHRPKKVSLTTGRHPGGGADRGAMRPLGAP